MHDIAITLSEATLIERITGGVRAYSEDLLKRDIHDASQLKAVVYILTHLQAIGGFDSDGKLDLTGIQKFYLGVLTWRPVDLSSAFLHELSAAFTVYAAKNHSPPLAKSILDRLSKQFPDQTDAVT